VFGIEATGGPAGAALLIGVVLVEAIVLYLGYGALERVFGPAITDAIRGD